MPKAKPYLSHSDVELEEVTEEDWALAGGVSTYRYWVASVNAKLNPTNETVSMSRQSKSAGEALLLLKEAIEEQGWELHE